jgi:hypothetical protein
MIVAETGGISKWPSESQFGAACIFPDFDLPFARGRV